MRPRPQQLLAGATAILCLQLGCSQPADTGTGAGLPPDTSDGGSDGGGGNAGTSWTGAGTGGGPAAGDDEAPDHRLSLIQEGSWTLSPPAGPYESLTGTLTVTELLDGDEDVPACTATFALTGVALDDTDTRGCADCTASFDVLHYLSEDGDTIPGEGGDDDIEIAGLDGCLAPDLPDHQDTWALGLASDSITRRLGQGTWLDWYEAERIGATVSFSWTATVGVEGDEDEEEE